jgi:hypothetical protein
VLILNGVYRGQKLMKLVNKNIAANIINTMPKAFVMVCVKYKTVIITAATSLITLSVDPMFFFIVTCFIVELIKQNYY